MAKQKNNFEMGSAKVPSGACFSCGGKHFRSECKFRETICHFCNAKGHIKKVCKKALANKQTNKTFVAPNLAIVYFVVLNPGAQYAQCAFNSSQ